MTDLDDFRAFYELADRIIADAAKGDARIRELARIRGSPFS